MSFKYFKYFYQRHISLVIGSSNKNTLLNWFYHDVSY